MGKYDSEYESSDSDPEDESFLKQIQSLSTACLPNITTTTTPSPLNVNVDVDANANAGLSLSDDNDLELVRSIRQRYGALVDNVEHDDDDDDNDLELVRSIQQRYGALVCPLTTPTPFDPEIDDDDDEDYDLELYRSIQDRFFRYCNDGASGIGGLGNAAASKDDSEHGSGHVDETVDENLDVHNRDDIEQEPCDDPRKHGGDHVDETVNENLDVLIDSCNTSTFPTAAQMFMDAIKKNRAGQKFIRNKMLHIEAKMEEINQIRKRLKTLRDFQIKCKKRIGRALSQKQDACIKLIAVPKQRSKNEKDKIISPMCYGPLENSDVASYKDALERFPISFDREKWSEEDREKLVKGMVQQYQENKLMQISSIEELGSNKGVDDMILSLRNHNVTSEMLQDFSSEVNWEQLAFTYLPRRSREECEARWLNYENRLINQGNWSANEDKRLLILIQQNGLHDWTGVAEKLGTNRTPFQCLARYQRSLNANILKRDWTSYEDDRLRVAVETFGESNWQAVACELEGRTGPQCSNRWKKTLHPSREKVGKWSAEEDNRLKVAVTLFGKSWHRLAQFVPGRTQVQCRERWVNVLDTSLKRGEWGEEEDVKLKAGIEEYGYRWSKVANCVSSRTDSQCRMRWQTLFPNEAQQLRAARNVKRVALVTNFVDREEERPALEPKDFVVSLPIEGSTIEQRSSDGLKKRKRKQSTELPDDDIIGTTKKRMRQRSGGSKTKKDDNVKGMKKSSESNVSDDAADIDDSNIPIKIMSRRARGVKPKVNYPNDA